MVRRLFQRVALSRQAIATFAIVLTLLLPNANARADEDKTFSVQEISDAAEGLFGDTTQGFAEIIEKVFSDLGRPTAYITGEEVSGAFVVGLRYGKGDLNIKAGGTSKVFWQGPSIGFDICLLYTSPSPRD